MAGEKRDATDAGRRKSVIPVPRTEEPADFDERVRQPGVQWLAANPDVARPRDFWTHCLPALREAFSNRCGYAAMLDATGGTVDHYLSVKNHRERAYEWKNYRLASGPMNITKKNADATVLDSHEIQAGWFEILLPSLQMRVTDLVPNELRERAEYTLIRLKLRDGERILQWRAGWYHGYRNGWITLEGLRQYAPLIAEAVERAGEEQTGT